MLVSQEDRTALIWAVQFRHTETVKALIETGADLNAKEKVRRTCSVSRGEDTLSVLDNRIEIF
jgi:ankyrin repeat protein